MQSLHFEISLSRSLVLNTAEIEDSFFADSKLIAIRSSLQGYRLCWYLNNMLCLHLKRTPELDICMDISARLPDNTGTLFEDMPATEQKVYFPVFSYQFPFSEAGIILYTNKKEGSILLPDLKQADYFFFLQYGGYLEQKQEYDHHLATIPEINWVRELDLARIKWKKNLIV